MIYFFVILSREVSHYSTTVVTFKSISTTPMLHALRQVTRFEIDKSVAAHSPLSKREGFVRVFPLQTIVLVLRATLTIPAAETSSNEKLRMIMLEVGESDPVEAWKKILRELSVFPVTTTRTPDLDEHASGAASSSAAVSTAAAAMAFVNDLYPPSTTETHNVTLFSYLTSTQPPTTSSVSCSNGIENASFSTPGALQARRPGSAYTHAASPKLAPGTFASSPISFTYHIPVTMPNIAAGYGCIALRLGLGHNPLSVSLGSYGGASCMSSLFIGTLVYRVNVVSAVEIECVSRRVFANRTHVQVSVTNVSSKNIHIHSVDFDLLSSRLGQFKDSLDTRIDHCPELRVAPKAIDDEAIQKLRQSIVVLPLVVDELRPHLQPMEMYCFQFVLQLKNHLGYMLVDRCAASANSSSPRKSAAASSSTRQQLSDSTELLAETSQNIEERQKAAQDHNGLVALLQNTFVSAVHVSYQSDEWDDPSSLFKADRSVSWSLC